MRRLTLIFIIFISCTSVNKEEILGKWQTIDEQGNYMELWLNDNFALSYLSSADEILIYHYELDGNTINFQLIESNFLDNHEFTIKINTITEDKLKTELIGQTIKQEKLTYNRISAEPPIIYRELIKNIGVVKQIQSRTKKTEHNSVYTQ